MKPIGSGELLVKKFNGFAGEQLVSHAAGYHVVRPGQSRESPGRGSPDGGGATGAFRTRPDARDRQLPVAAGIQIGDVTARSRCTFAMLRSQQNSKPSATAFPRRQSACTAAHRKPVHRQLGFSSTRA